MAQSFCAWFGDLMKVIGRDNYGRDYNGGRSEEVAGENLSQEDAERLALTKNRQQGPLGVSTFYVVMPDDYEPYVFEGY